MLFNVYPSQTAGDKVVKLDIENYFKYPFTDKGMERSAHTYAEDTLNNKLYLLSSFCITEVDIHSKAAKFISTKRYDTGFVEGQSVIDENGILWMNDSEKLLHFDVKRMQPTLVLPKEAVQSDMLNAMNVIYKDRSGVIWLGTKGYGILNTVRNPKI